MNQTKKATIHLLHGFICSGKTTFAKKLENKDNKKIRFTHDERMVKLYGTNPPEEVFQSYYQHVEDLIWEYCEKLIKCDIDVIIDFGLWKKESRHDAIAKAESFLANIKLYHIICSEKERLKRLDARPWSIDEGTLHITPKIYEKLKKRYEPLQKDEIGKRIEIGPQQQNVA